MTKNKTKNTILASILCLLMLISSMFMLTACFGEPDDANKKVVKDDFTSAEIEVIWNKALANITSADRISFDAVLEQADSTVMQVKTVATNTIFYQKMCLVSNNNTSITESWAVVDGENIVSYMVQTESGQTTYSKESQTMEYDKIKNIFSGYFDSTAVNADYVSGCKKYADDSYTISLNVLSEETHRLVELTINADFKLVKITADVEAIGPSAIGTKGVIEYKYGLDADTMPARGYHEEWED